MSDMLRKLASIKVTPLWSVWCLWVLAMTSMSTGAILFASAVAGGSELIRFAWRDMLADLKATYWWNRVMGGDS